MIYLDNAATTGKKPLPVIAAVESALKEYSANPGRSGHKLSEKSAIRIFESRERISRFFGADDPAAVGFTLNCTHALNCVIKGVLKKGDHCITSSLEHNAVMRPLKKIGVDYEIANVSFSDDNETIENFKRLLRPNTKLIICTGASNVFGKILPIEKIGELCFERGISFAVDAAQISGVIKIDMAKMHIDYLCIAPHKGLYAPMGIGILIAKKPLEDTIIEGGTGTNSFSLIQPDTMPEQIESGTINLPGIFGVTAGIDYIERIGINKIYNHELRLISYLYNSLADIPGVTLYTPNPLKYNYAPVLSFNIAGVESESTARYLNNNGIAVRAGLHCAPAAHIYAGTIENGTVRVCPSIFTSKNDILIFINAIKKFKA